MAATALPRSEHAGLATGSARSPSFSPKRAARRAVEIGRIELLAGGAIQENWGIDAEFRRRAARRAAAPGAAHRRRDRGAVEPRPGRGIRRAPGGVRRRGDGAGAAVRLRRPGGARQAVFRDAAGRRQRRRPADHARPGSGAGAARRSPSGWAASWRGLQTVRPPRADLAFLLARRPGRASTSPRFAPISTGIRTRGRCSNGRCAGPRRTCRSRCRRCCATAISAPAITCWTARG